MSISHWGMFFGVFTTEYTHGAYSSVGRAVWKPVTPEEFWSW